MKNKVVLMPKDQNEDIFVAKNIDITLNYKKYYKRHNFLIRGWRTFIQFVIAKPLFWLYSKIFLGVKIVGKKNIKKIKTGAVVVANHVHYMDWSMTSTFISKSHKTVVVSLKDNFKIPVARKLIEVYGCLPIPNTARANIDFNKCIDRKLKEKCFVHVFPEAALWPYYTKLRTFKNGAFHFAVRNSVPVINNIITFRKSKGLAKLIRRKPRITLVVGEPQYIDENLERREQIKELENRVKGIMEKMVLDNPSEIYLKYIPEEYKNKKE